VNFFLSTILASTCRDKVTILNSGYSVITPIDAVLELVEEDVPTGSIKKQ
jgi:hypothetical protein